MTEANKEGQEDSGFTLISAKEQQKRDSIMNELYNDMSSSDDEEEEKKGASVDGQEQEDEEQGKDAYEEEAEEDCANEG